VNEEILPSFGLSLPADFAEYEWEVAAKGWFVNAWLTVSSRRFRLVFYDAARLAQEIQNELDSGRVFFEPNLVVVHSVTRAKMEQAAAWLVQSGRVASLIADSPAQQSSLDER
jgi:hypothetical protein